MRDKKIHILNIDDARICGSKLPGPNTEKASEGTCQGCIDGVHPALKLCAMHGAYPDSPVAPGVVCNGRGPNCNQIKGG